MLRVLSTLIAFSFLVQDMSFAVSVIPVGKRPHQIMSQIDPSIATIDEVLQTDSEKIIYLIQDAHANYSAQKNISDILNQLDQKAGLEIIFLEAANGKISWEESKRNASSETRKKVADKYLRSADLQGVEYYEITNDETPVIWGVESKRLYQQALEAFRDVENNREHFKSTLTRILKSIDELKILYYRPALQQLDQLRREWLSDEVSFAVYLKYLSLAASRTSLNMKIYPLILRAEKIAELESAVNFSKANSEIQLLLSGSDSVSEITELEREILQKMVSGSAPTFGKEFDTSTLVSVLKKIINSTNHGESVYPNADQYINYLEAVNSFNLIHLIKEEKRLFDVTMRALGQSEAEKNVYRLSSAGDKLKMLSDFKLESNDYVEYRSLARWGVRLLIGVLNEMLLVSEVDLRMIHEWKDDFGNWIQSAEKFYDLTFERDQYFIDSIESKLEQEGFSSAAFIAGGFHTENIKHHLRSKGYSYVVLTPVVQHETPQETYKQLLLSQEYDGDSIEIASIQKTSSFGLNYWTRSQIPAVSGQIMKEMMNADAEYSNSASRLAGANRRGEYPNNVSLKKVLQDVRQEYLDADKRNGTRHAQKIDWSGAESLDAAMLAPPAAFAVLYAAKEILNNALDHHVGLDAISVFFESDDNASLNIEISIVNKGDIPWKDLADKAMLYASLKQIHWNDENARDIQIGYGQPNQGYSVMDVELVETLANHPDLRKELLFIKGLSAGKRENSIGGAGIGLHYSRKFLQEVGADLDFEVVDHKNDYPEVIFYLDNIPLVSGSRLSIQSRLQNLIRGWLGKNRNIQAMDLKEKLIEMRKEGRSGARLADSIGIPEVIRSRYNILSKMSGGGSSAQTLLVEDASGENRVLKFATWSGIGSNGIPWLRNQFKRLKEMKDLFPNHNVMPIPEVYDYYEDEGLAYYTLEYFEDGTPLSLYYVNNLNPDPNEFLSNLSQLLDVMVDNFYSRGKMALPEGYVQKIHFDRLDYRLGLLRTKEGEVYDHLLKDREMLRDDGVSFQIADLFYQITGSRILQMNGDTYENPEKILHEIKDNPRMLQQISPSYLPLYGHGDALLRNFMRLNSGEIKIFDIRGVEPMKNSPSRVDIPYEIGKLLHGIQLELIRNDLFDLKISADESGMYRLDVSYDEDNPRVAAFLEVRKKMEELIKNHPGLNRILSDEPDWFSKALFAEATHFLSDAPNRLENDSTGRHAVAYYAIGTILLNQYYEEFLQPLSNTPKESGSRLAIGEGRSSVDAFKRATEKAMGDEDEVLVYPPFVENGIYVRRGVFNPAIKNISSQVLAANLGVKKGDRVLDVGSGTGYQSIVALMNGADFALALDKYEEPLENINRNRDHLSLQDELEVRKSDLLNELLPDEKFDLIVFAPPLLEGSVSNSLEGSVLDESLSETLRRFFNQSRRHLAENGRIRMIYSLQKVGMLSELAGEYGLSVSVIHTERFQENKRSYVILELVIQGSRLAEDFESEKKYEKTVISDEDYEALKRVTPRREFLDRIASFMNRFDLQSGDSAVVVGSHADLAAPFTFAAKGVNVTVVDNVESETITHTEESIMRKVGQLIDQNQGRYQTVRPVGYQHQPFEPDSLKLVYFPKVLDYIPVLKNTIASDDGRGEMPLPQYMIEKSMREIENGGYLVMSFYSFWEDIQDYVSNAAEHLGIQAEFIEDVPNVDYFEGQKIIAYRINKTSGARLTFNPIPSEFTLDRELIQQFFNYGYWVEIRPTKRGVRAHINHVETGKYRYKYYFRDFAVSGAIEYLPKLTGTPGTYIDWIFPRMPANGMKLGRAAVEIATAMYLQKNQDRGRKINIDVTEPEVAQSFSEIESFNGTVVDLAEDSAKGFSGEVSVVLDEELRYWEEMNRRNQYMTPSEYRKKVLAREMLSFDPYLNAQAADKENIPSKEDGSRLSFSISDEDYAVLKWITPRRYLLENIASFMNQVGIKAQDEVVFVGSWVDLAAPITFAAKGAEVTVVDVATDDFIPMIESEGLEKIQPMMNVAQGAYESVRPVKYQEYAIQPNSKKLIHFPKVLDAPGVFVSSTDTPDGRKGVNLSEYMLEKAMMELQDGGYLTMSFYAFWDQIQLRLERAAERLKIRLEPVATLPDIDFSAAKHLIAYRVFKESGARLAQQKAENPDEFQDEIKKLVSATNAFLEFLGEYEWPTGRAGSEKIAVRQQLEHGVNNFIMPLTWLIETGSYEGLIVEDRIDDLEVASDLAVQFSDQLENKVPIESSINYRFPPTYTITWNLVGAAIKSFELGEIDETSSASFVSLALQLDLLRSIFIEFKEKYSATLEKQNQTSEKRPDLKEPAELSEDQKSLIIKSGIQKPFVFDLPFEMIQDIFNGVDQLKLDSDPLLVEMIEEASYQGAIVLRGHRKLFIKERKDKGEWMMYNMVFDSILSWIESESGQTLEGAEKFLLFEAMKNASLYPKDDDLNSIMIVRWAPTAEGIQISIADEGESFNPEERKSPSAIFDDFYFGDPISGGGIRSIRSYLNPREQKKPKIGRELLNDDGHRVGKILSLNFSEKTPGARLAYDSTDRQVKQPGVDTYALNYDLVQRFFDRGYFIEWFDDDPEEISAVIHHPLTKKGEALNSNKYFRTGSISMQSSKQVNTSGMITFFADKAKIELDMIYPNMPRTGERLGQAAIEIVTAMYFQRYAPRKRSFLVHSTNEKMNQTLLSVTSFNAQSRQINKDGERPAFRVAGSVPRLSVQEKSYWDRLNTRNASLSSETFRAGQISGIFPEDLSNDEREDSQNASRLAEVPKTEAFRRITEYINHPFDQELSELAEGLGDLNGQEIGSIDRAGQIVFRPVPGYPYKWPVLGFYADGYTAFIDGAQLDGPYIQLKIRVRHSDPEIEDVVRTFWITDQVKVLNGRNDKKGTTVNVRLIADHLESPTPVKDYLEEIISMSPDTKFSSRKDLKEKLNSLKGKSVGKTDVNGRIALIPQTNYLYDWPVIQKAEEGYEGILENADIEYGLIRLDFRFSKPDKEDMVRTFWIGPYTADARGQNSLLGKRISVLKPTLNPGKEAVISLVNLNPDTDFKTIPEHLLRLNGQQIGDVHSGQITLRVGENYFYAWPIFGSNESDYRATIIDSSVSGNLIRLQIRLENTGEVTRDRPKSINRNLWLTHLTREVKGTGKETGNQKSILLISDQPGLDLIRHLVTYPEDYDFNQLPEYFKEFKGQGVGMTDTNGWRAFTPIEHFSYPWGALGTKKSGYWGEVDSTKLVGNRLQFSILFRRTGSRDIRRYFQIGPFRKTLRHHDGAGEIRQVWAIESLDAVKNITDPDGVFNPEILGQYTEKMRPIVENMNPSDVVIARMLLEGFEEQVIISVAGQDQKALNEVKTVLHDAVLDYTDSGARLSGDRLNTDYGGSKSYSRSFEDENESVDGALSGMIENVLKDMQSFESVERPIRMLYLGAGSGVGIFEMQQQYPGQIEVDPVNLRRLSLSVEDFMSYVSKNGFSTSKQQITEYLDRFNQKLMIIDIDLGLSEIESGSYDAVYLSKQVMRYIRNKHLVLSEIKRVLRKGGRAVVSQAHDVQHQFLITESESGATYDFFDFINRLVEIEGRSGKEIQYDPIWTAQSHGFSMGNLRPEEPFPILEWKEPAKVVRGYQVPDGYSVHYTWNSGSRLAEEDSLEKLIQDTWGQVEVLEAAGELHRAMVLLVELRNKLSVDSEKFKQDIKTVEDNLRIMRKVLNIYQSSADFLQIINYAVAKNSIQDYRIISEAESEDLAVYLIEIEDVDGSIYYALTASEINEDGEYRFAFSALLDKWESLNAIHPHTKTFIKGMGYFERSLLLAFEAGIIESVESNKLLSQAAENAYERMRKNSISDPSYPLLIEKVDGHYEVRLKPGIAPGSRLSEQTPLPIADVIRQIVSVRFDSQMRDHSGFIRVRYLDGNNELKTVEGIYARDELVPYNVNVTKAEGLQLTLRGPEFSEDYTFETRESSNRVVGIEILKGDELPSWWVEPWAQNDEQSIRIENPVRPIVDPALQDLSFFQRINQENVIRVTSGEVGKIGSLIVEYFPDYDRYKVTLFEDPDWAASYHVHKRIIEVNSDLSDARVLIASSPEEDVDRYYSGYLSVTQDFQEMARLKKAIEFFKQHAPSIPSLVIKAGTPTSDPNIGFSGRAEWVLEMTLQLIQYEQFGADEYRTDLRHHDASKHEGIRKRYKAVNDDKFISAVDALINRFGEDKFTEALYSRFDKDLRSFRMRELPYMPHSHMGMIGESITQLARESTNGLFPMPISPLNELGKTMDANEANIRTLFSNVSLWKYLHRTYPTVFNAAVDHLLSVSGKVWRINESKYNEDPIAAIRDIYPAVYEFIKNHRPDFLSKNTIIEKIPGEVSLGLNLDQGARLASEKSKEVADEDSRFEEGVDQAVTALLTKSSRAIPFDSDLSGRAYVIAAARNIFRNLWDDFQNVAERSGYQNVADLIAEEFYIGLPLYEEINEVFSIGMIRQSQFARHTKVTPGLYPHFKEKIRQKVDEWKKGDRPIRFLMTGPGFMQEPIEMLILTHLAIQESGREKDDIPVEFVIFDFNDNSGFFERMAGNDFVYGSQEIERLAELAGDRFRIKDYFKKEVRGYRLKSKWFEKFQFKNVDLSDPDLLFNVSEPAKIPDFIFSLNVDHYLEIRVLPKLLSVFYQLMGVDSSLYTTANAPMPYEYYERLPDEMAQKANPGEPYLIMTKERLFGARLSEEYQPYQELFDRVISQGSSKVAGVSIPSDQTLMQFRIKGLQSKDKSIRDFVLKDVLTIDLEQGRYAHVSLPGVFTLLSADDHADRSVLSVNHNECISCAVRAVKDNKLWIGQAHILPDDEVAFSSYVQYWKILQYLMENGFEKESLQLVFSANHLFDIDHGFPPQKTIDELRAIAAEDAGLDPDNIILRGREFGVFGDVWIDSERVLTRHRNTTSTSWYEDLGAIGSRLSIDHRPVEAGISREAFIRYDEAVKSVVNPAGKPLKVIYGGSGADIAHFLKTFDPTEGVFVSYFFGLTQQDLQDVVTMTGFGIDKLKASDGNNLEAYLKHKQFNGFANRHHVDELYKIKQVLAYELLGSGAIDIKVVGGVFPTLEFKWAYEVGGEPQVRRIQFVEADITQPQKYPEGLKTIIQSGFDGFYLRAGVEIASKYGQINSPFIEYLYNHINQNGVFVTDDTGVVFNDFGGYIHQTQAQYFYDLFPVPFEDIERLSIPDLTEISQSILGMTPPAQAGPGDFYGWFMRLRQVKSSIQDRKKFVIPGLSDGARLSSEWLDEKIVAAEWVSKIEKALAEQSEAGLISDFGFVEDLEWINFSTRTKISTLLENGELSDALLLLRALHSVYESNPATIEPDTEYTGSGIRMVENLMRSVESVEDLTPAIRFILREEPESYEILNRISNDEFEIYFTKVKRKDQDLYIHVAMTYEKQPGGYRLAFVGRIDGYGVQTEHSGEKDLYQPHTIAVIKGKKYYEKTIAALLQSDTASGLISNTVSVLSDAAKHSYELMLKKSASKEYPLDVQFNEASQRYTIRLKATSGSAEEKTITGARLASKQDTAGRIPFRLELLRKDFWISPTTLVPNDQKLPQLIQNEVATLISDGDSVLEVGTGSGVLTAVMKTASSKKARTLFVATDINPDAVQDATENLSEYKDVEVREGSLFIPVKPGEKFKFILWNPPWYPQRNDDEPYALAMYDENYQALKTFFAQAAQFLTDDGSVYIAFDADYADHLWNIGETHGWTPEYINGYRSNKQHIGLYRFTPSNKAPSDGAGARLTAAPRLSADQIMDALSDMGRIYTDDAWHVIPVGTENYEVRKHERNSIEIRQGENIRQIEVSRVRRTANAANQSGWFDSQKSADLRRAMKSVIPNQTNRVVLTIHSGPIDGLNADDARVDMYYETFAKFAFLRGADIRLVDDAQRQDSEILQVAQAIVNRSRLELAEDGHKITSQLLNQNDSNPENAVEAVVYGSGDLSGRVEGAVHLAVSRLSADQPNQMADYLSGAALLIATAEQVRFETDSDGKTQIQRGSVSDQIISALAESLGLKGSDRNEKIFWMLEADIRAKDIFFGAFLVDQLITNYKFMIRQIAVMA